MEIETTSGIARPSAWGQAITSTVIARTNASCGVPTKVHTVAATSADPSAYQNSQPAARSARSWARVEEACASATSRWMPASAVSAPIAVIRTRRELSVATVPATTRSPTSRWTGLDSPVIIDSSTAAPPSITSPSAGTRPPGRTTTTSSTTSSAGGTTTVPSPSTFSASSGRRAARESSAEEVWARERISSQCPSSMITTRRASSHQKSSSCGRRPRLAPREAPNATVIAVPISSIMPGRRSRISDTAPVRNGRPPQK